MPRKLSYIVFLALLFSQGLLKSIHAQATESTVYTFCYPGCVVSGESPQTGVILGPDGDLYGTTYGGGIGEGVVFRYSTTSGTITTLYAFGSNFEGTGGSNPGNVTLGPDGNFYGVTISGGGKQEAGTLFKVTPSGTLTTLYSFCQQGVFPNCPDGWGPETLTLGSDGNFYGTTGAGGAYASTCDGYGCGTIFKLTPSGVLTTLHSFNDTDGSGPFSNAPMVQGSDGYFYGTTLEGGTNGVGTVFKISLSGSFTSLYSFDLSGTGDEPQAGLVEGSDGNFYGSAGLGGGSGIYKITPSGNFNTLFTFNGTDGEGPDGTLVIGGDGNFYGVTEAGGAYNEDNGMGCSYGGCGTVFSLTPSGVLATLYNFCSQLDQNGFCVNGDQPLGALAPAGAGAFYGTNSNATSGGGAQETDAEGNIFMITVPTTAPAPVQISLSQSSVTVGSPVTATLAVSNAFSTTLQQCYGFSTLNATTTALGKLPGTLSNGIFGASIPFTPTAAGTYLLGTTCGGTESGFATLTVSLPASTTTLAVTPNPSVGQSVMLKATVGASSGTPTGSVSFFYNGASIGSAKLAGGVATLTASTGALPAGTYPITAKYGGSSAYAASSSSSTPVTLNNATTTTTLVANPVSVTPPNTVSLVATVARSAGYTGVPTGNVSYYDGTLLIGQAKLNEHGVATFKAATKGIASGTYPITATYSGDSGDSTSGSAPANVTVE